MKTIKAILGMILLILIILFSFQNLGIMTVKFFNWSLSMPKALVIILAYILGMMTGGIMVSMLRTLLVKTAPADEKSDREQTQAHNFS